MTIRQIKTGGLHGLWAFVFLLAGCHDEDYDDYKIPLQTEENRRFEEYMLQFDLDGDGYISIREARNVKELDCSGMGLTSLKFIQYFPELERLDCSENRLKSIDLSENVKLKELITNYSFFYGTADGVELNLSTNTALERLICRGVYTKSIDLTQNRQLRKLHITSCNLGALDLSHCEKLEDLSLDGVFFEQPVFLNVENSRLKTVICVGSLGIESLNFAGCEQLDSLHCDSPNGRGGATAIDMAGCAALKYLHLTNGNYQTPDIRSCLQLKELRLESIDVDISEHTELEHVYLEKGSLLYPIPKNTKLKTLHCRTIENAEEVDLRNQILLENLWCTDIKPVRISNCKMLQHLHLADSSSAESMATETFCLKDFPELLTVRIPYSKRFEKIELSDCPQLSDIHLSSIIDTLKVNNCARLNVMDVSETAFDVVNIDLCPALEAFNSYNQIKTLRINNCKSLKTLYCNNVGLRVFDVNECPALEELECAYNRITTLSPGKFERLKSLTCNNNLLTQLDLRKNVALVSLNCSVNEGITELDLRHNENLRWLYCGDERVPDLNVYLRKGHEPSYLYMVSGTVVYVE